MDLMNERRHFIPRERERDNIGLNQGKHKQSTRMDSSLGYNVTVQGPGEARCSQEVRGRPEVQKLPC